MARKEKKYHFIYKTTNLLSGRYYIGMHSTNDLNDGYMGSGKRLRRSLNKYGKQNHKVEILEFFESREELKKREKEIVTLNEIAKIECMNLAVGGGGGFISEDQQKRRSIIANKARNFKMNTDLEFNAFVRKKISDGIKLGYKNGRKGKNNFSWKDKKLPKKMKEKISASLKGKGIGEKNSQYNTCWINNGKYNKKISKNLLDQYLKKNWFIGCIKKVSDKDLKKIIKMKEDGMSLNNISKEFLISKTTVRSYLK